MWHIPETPKDKVIKVEDVGGKCPDLEDFSDHYKEFGFLLNELGNNWTRYDLC